MGKLRRKSEDRLKLDLKERDTLLPCGACMGNGVVVEENANGRYKVKKCIWCNGLGGYTRTMAAAHARWVRILTHNQKVGACKK